MKLQLLNKKQKNASLKNEALNERKHIKTEDIEWVENEKFIKSKK
tara:strand:+ start:15254 stop:15388 length:135 start_codon:yes stop_codon:yes gene_type:complete